MLALLAHGGALERRAAAGDHAHRIAGGVGVDAEEGVLAHGRSYWKRSMPKGARLRSPAPGDEIGDVAGGDRRKRQAEMAVAEGEDDARVAAGGRR